MHQIIVVADAGFATHAPLHLIPEKKDAYVVAIPRTRQFTHGKHLWALSQHQT
jgi:hypothetical protein